MMHQSIATIDSPEFINLQPLEINPLMSSCQIKVLYLGENRNGSFITKDVANEMAKTLRGAPIVGYYKEEKQDFMDHGEKMTFDGDGVHFECMTKPYGFVAPDAEVWFQKFEDTDEFGNTTVREYLMTTGYLWTGQYEECRSVIEEGRPQSMELDEESLEGHWATNNKTGMDFFIINDAIFSKLCILGEDVEPCFEGSSITAETKAQFALDDNFKKTLYTMMQDLKFALKGGLEMEIGKTITEDSIVANEETPATEEIENEEVVTEEETAASEEIVETEDSSENNEEEIIAEETIVESESIEESSDIEDNEEQSISEETEEIIEGQEDLSVSEDNQVSIEEYTALQDRCAELETENESLRAFKLAVEDKEKDNLIASFYMLSDADKADVIANKANYTLEEIESKLSVICVRNKVSFELDTDEEPSKKDVMTYSLHDSEDASTPAWVKACINTRNSKK